MDKDVAHHLVHNYGTRALQLAEMAIAEPSERFRSQDSSGTFFWRRLSPQYPQLEAEVVFAVRHEYGLPWPLRRHHLAFIVCPYIKSVYHIATSSQSPQS
jgi:glycerol-3-phosphate dehydrogenase